MEKEITVAISTNSLPFASFHPPAYYSIENANRGDWWNARDHWQQQFCTSPHSSVVFAPLKRAPSLQITLRNCPLLSSPSLSEWGQQWMQFLHLSLSLSLLFRRFAPHQCSQKPERQGGHRLYFIEMKVLFTRGSAKLFSLLGKVCCCRKVIRLVICISCFCCIIVADAQPCTAKKANKRFIIGTQTGNALYALKISDWKLDGNTNEDSKWPFLSQPNLSFIPTSALPNPLYDIFHITVNSGVGDCCVVARCVADASNATSSCGWMR